MDRRRPIVEADGPLDRLYRRCAGAAWPRRPPPDPRHRPRGLASGGAMGVDRTQRGIAGIGPVAAAAGAAPSDRAGGPGADRDGGEAGSDVRALREGGGSDGDARCGGVRVAVERCRCRRREARCAAQSDRAARFGRDQPTKTRSARTVTLDGDTVAALKTAWRAAGQLARFAGVDDGTRRAGYVFSFDADGASAWRGDSVSARWVRVRRTAGVEAVRLHDLGTGRRHTDRHLVRHPRIRSQGSTSRRSFVCSPIRRAPSR